jgi:hypothetical protein
MTVYYRSRDLVIDTHAFITRSEVYALTDLSEIHIGRAESAMSRRTATHAVAGALVLAIAAGPIFDSPAGWAVAAVTIIATLSAGGISRLLHRPRWQLLATHRGSGVCLLSTTDALTFGQVRRGLVRALEAGRRV